MENSNNYYNERNKDLILKIREITSELPAWFADYIRSIEPTTSSLTRYNYCCDARIFLNYLTTEVRSIAGTPIAEITPEMIDSLSLRDLEIYIDHLGFYLKAGKDDNGQIKEVFNSDGNRHQLIIIFQIRKVAIKSVIIPLGTVMNYPMFHITFSRNHIGRTSFKCHNTVISAAGRIPHGKAHKFSRLTGASKIIL